MLIAVFLLGFIGLPSTRAQKDPTVLGGNPPPSDVPASSIDCFSKCQTLSDFMKKDDVFDGSSSVQQIKDAMCPGYNSEIACISKCDDSDKLIAWMTGVLPQEIRDVVKECPEYDPQAQASGNVLVHKDDAADGKAKMSDEKNSGRGLRAPLEAMVGVVLVVMVI